MLTAEDVMRAAGTSRRLEKEHEVQRDLSLLTTNSTVDYKPGNQETNSWTSEDSKMLYACQMTAIKGMISNLLYLDPNLSFTASGASGSFTLIHSTIQILNSYGLRPQDLHRDMNDMTQNSMSKGESVVTLQRLLTEWPHLGCFEEDTWLAFGRAGKYVEVDGGSAVEWSWSWSL